MISVIIPVCWGHKPFADFLANLVELPVIGEVVLINNNKHLTPNHDVLFHDKIKHYVMHENIYTNPAFNFGAEVAKHDVLCFLNDDVLVDLRVFLEADKFVSEEIGTLSIGINDDQFKAMQNQFDDLNPRNILFNGDVKILEFGPSANYAGAGSLFFIHKNNWVDIPKPFKIYFGDRWIFDIQNIIGKINYHINNAFYYTPWHMASKIGIANEYLQTEEYLNNESREKLLEFEYGFAVANGFDLPNYLLEFKNEVAK
jgi:hypothetical protein